MDDKLCGTIAYSSSKTSYEIQCGRSGKTVKITTDRTSIPLTLCEVKVFGSSLPSRELSFTGAAQGSTRWEGVASRAIDGNTDGRFSKK